MVVVRRSLLTIFVLAAPVAMVALLYAVSVFGLAITKRTIDPEILRYSAAAEFIVFLFLAVIEAKDRW